MKRIRVVVQKGYCPECARFLSGNGYSGMRKHRRMLDRRPGDNGVREIEWCPGSGQPPLASDPRADGASA